MTSFARLRHASSLSRWTAFTAAVLSSGILLSLVLVAPARAVVTTVGGTSVGVQPRETEAMDAGWVKLNEANELLEDPAGETFDNKAGNPVLHGVNVYAVYWDPTNHYHGDWQGLVNGFLHNVAGASGRLDNVLAVDGQYTDKSNQPATGHVTFRGAYTDTDQYPGAGCEDPHPLQTYQPGQTKAITCLSDKQMREELGYFIALHGLPKGMGTLYYLLTPPGVGVCLDGGGASGHCSDFQATAESYKHSFCSYHGDINPGGLESGDASTVLYSVVPWTAGGLDDGQLAPQDQTVAYHCQDGGFNPEKGEHHEGSPVQQEPNQQPCPTTDGFCDVALADLIINQVGVELQNTVTNPMLNAWQNSAKSEVTDMCRNFFAPVLGGSYKATEAVGAGTLYNQQLTNGHYYVNNSFNEAAFKLRYPGVQCLNGVNLVPQFTAPSTVNAGDTVGFDGMESNITLNAGTNFTEGGAPKPNYATYSWNFGDGSPAVTGYAPGAPNCEAPWLSPCAASAFHAYQYGGNYQVTLTVTDVAGNTTSVTHTVTVVGPAPPSSGGGSGGGSGGSSGGGSGGTSGGGSTSAASAGGGSTPGAGKPAATPPVAAGAVVSHSLRRSLRHGLIVRYSVNEQVAGRFEVLIDRTLARRLHVSGPSAFGLPAGTAPQLVIGRALLVTTAGGRNTVTIVFSKGAAARLAHVRALPLMLRMFVHASVAHGGGAATVLSAFTLSH